MNTLNSLIPLNPLRQKPATHNIKNTSHITEFTQESIKINSSDKCKVFITCENMKRLIYLVKTRGSQYLTTLGTKIQNHASSNEHISVADAKREVSKIIAEHKSKITDDVYKLDDSITCEKIEVDFHINTNDLILFKNRVSDIKGIITEINIKNKRFTIKTTDPTNKPQIFYGIKISKLCVKNTQCKSEPETEPKPCTNNNTMPRP